MADTQTEQTASTEVTETDAGQSDQTQQQDVGETEEKTTEENGDGDQTQEAGETQQEEEGGTGDTDKKEEQEEEAAAEKEEEAGDTEGGGGGDGEEVNEETSQEETAAETQEETAAETQEETTEEEATGDGDQQEETEQTEAADDEEAAGEEGDSEQPTTQEQDEGEEQTQVELSDQQRERYRQLYERKAVNDRLDLKGFKILLRLMGEVVPSSEAEQMFEDGDRDGDNTISFEEFCRLHCKFSQAEHARKESMLASLDKLFPGMDGESVELNKVERVLLKLQQPDLDMRLVREKSDLNSDDIRSLVRAMDTDGNGRISKEEFVGTLCQHLEA